jgi:hypothetical protein
MFSIENRVKPRVIEVGGRVDILAEMGEHANCRLRY